tara:strand:- start:134 stop:778 length:645 start_codon:yes stop_codon:yes gene_type:complete
MPNWCDNQVTITGPESVIDKIEKIVREEENIDLSSKEKGESMGLLNFMYPMPKELDGTTSPSSSADKPQPMVDGFDNWYDWRCENWSTKWDVNEFYGVDRQGDTISFGFSSAWSPPIGAYEKFLADNEDCSLKAYYYEGGCDFMGEWDNGSDDCYAPSNYKSTDDFWNDGVGSTLDDMFNITESMAEYEAELEAEKEDVHEYVKGKAMNIGEEA